MSGTEPGPSYIPAAPGLRWVSAMFGSPEFAMLTLENWVNNPDPILNSEQLIAWRVFASSSSPADEVVRPVTLSGERNLTPETIEGLLYPDGRVQVSAANIGYGTYRNLGEFFRKAVEMAEQYQQATAKGRDR